MEKQFCVNCNHCRRVIRKVQEGNEINDSETALVCINDDLVEYSVITGKPKPGVVLCDAIINYRPYASFTSIENTCIKIRNKVYQPGRDGIYCVGFKERNSAGEVPEIVLMMVPVKKDDARGE